MGLKRKYLYTLSSVILQLNFPPSRTCGWDPVTGKEYIP